MNKAVAANPAAVLLLRCGHRALLSGGVGSGCSGEAAAIGARSGLCHLTAVSISQLSLRNPFSGDLGALAPHPGGCGPFRRRLEWGIPLPRCPLWGVQAGPAVPRQR